MSVSLLEVLEDEGIRPFDNEDDAQWLISVQGEFERLVDDANEVIEELEDKRREEEIRELEAEQAESEN